MSILSYRKITTASIIAMIKYLLVGFLFAEVGLFSRVISLKINPYIFANCYERWIIYVICILSFLIIIFYSLNREVHLDIVKIAKSKRFDIVFVFCFGVFLGLSFGDISMKMYAKFISLFSDFQLIMFVLLPILLSLLLVIRSFTLKYFRKEDNEESFFINDEELESTKDDLLDFEEQAEKFAERVYNRGSLDSMVFGVDAPWGVGKSTFVNFCKKYWEKTYKDEVIVYKFSPLKYEGDSNLLERFIDELIREIQKHSFVPEIRPLISRYSRFITKGTLSFCGFNFELSPGSYTVDDASEDLKSAILDLDKKIIIVIDDLDRLNFSTIRDVLFVIKKSFILPNISYVLCYDTENISALEKDKPDCEKIAEFFEKFVNVKIGIYIDSSTFVKYLSENLEIALSQNLQIDPKVVQEIKKVVSALVRIYKSDDFYKYLPFIGDVRKLKKLINIILLFEIQKTDFDNTDFNKRDLIHLLLIYINYPSIFRKIYNSETNGKRGIFSVRTPLEKGYLKDKSKSVNLGDENEYKNVKSYSVYVKTLTQNQRFLLDEVFDVSKRLKDAKIDAVSQKIRTSYACFNGGGFFSGGRNLEEYLNLIVKSSKPQKTGQHRFYLKCRDRIIKGESVKKVLSDKEFSNERSESSHMQFWRVVVNSVSDFDSKIGTRFVRYLSNNIKNYSFLRNEKVGLGLRDDIDLFIIRLLDDVGWSDENGKNENNTEQNVSEIAEWIFGEKRHVKEGIIDILSKEDRGVLGFYDLFSFRLYCSADRGGHFFNLQRALSKHSNSEAPTSGPTKDIVVEEMREISQNVFNIFKKQYIDSNKNFFDSVDELSLGDLVGNYKQFVDKKVESGEIKDIEKSIAGIKSRIKAFILYQIGNSDLSMGIGCGYYDQSGIDDKEGIRNEINKYLFDICFNGINNPKNYEHFLDYLLTNFARAFGIAEGEQYIPDVKEFTKVMREENIKDYWEQNRDTIKLLKLTDKDKTVVTSNYTVFYKKDLIKVYDMLDKYVDNFQKKDTK